MKGTPLVFLARFSPSKDNRVEVCHKVKPFTIREQKMLRVAPPKSKVQQRINTKMTTNLRLWLSKLLMNFYKLTIGGCPFSKEHRWRFFSTVTYCQKSEVFMIVIMIGTTFLFCDMGWVTWNALHRSWLFCVWWGEIVQRVHLHDIYWWVVRTT